MRENEDQSSPNLGKLSLCGTPIGNLDDITLRVLKTLQECQVIYAEDTRHSIKLLNHFGISKPLYSYHEHNMERAGLEILDKIRAGDHVALVTDAGMPGISDPGEMLVKLCIEAGLPFEVVPGVTAFTTALVGSGLDTSRFVFEGFLSRDKKQRRQLLEKIAKETRTLIFYESPHRLKETLKQLISVLGERDAVVARELTKRYETFERGKLSDILAYYEAHEVKGEIVLLVRGYKMTTEDEMAYDLSESVADHVNRLIKTGMDKKEAMKAVAIQRKMKKSEVYSALLED